MDYQSLLYAPIYRTHGVPGTINGVAGFTVLDKTSGLEWRDKGPEVQSIECAAVVRATELVTRGVVTAVNAAGLAPLENGSLEMNGETWNIETYKLKPSPKGQGDGEVVLILTEAMDEESESE